MKKVHYIAGIAGLGSVAAAGLVGTATGATAQTAHVGAAVKTVSLQATTVTTPCSLNNQKIPQQGDVKGGFFYDITGGGESDCVGSVYWSVYYGSHRVCRNLTATIAGREYTDNNICGSGTVKRKKAVDRIFGAPFLVCLGATRVPGHPCGLRGQG